MNQLELAKIDLNLLRSLHALLQERHVSKAAARLHVTPSAMSHSLARLRDTFDDPLLVKSGAKLEPTPRALKLEEQVAGVMEQIGKLLEPEAFDPGKVSARVRVHTHSYIIASYLTPFFAQTHSRAPKLTFDTHAFSERSYEQMEKGDVDLIVSAGMGAPAHLMQRRIIEEDMVCLVDQRHPAINNWCLETFFHYPHIKNTLMSDRSDILTEGLRKQELPARDIGFYVDDIMTQLVIIKESELIATLPRSMGELGRSLYGHVMLPCPVELPSFVIKAIWHKRSQKDAMLCWLRKQLIEEIS